MVKIIIYEDNDGLRESIRLMLEIGDGISVAGAFKDASNVISDIKELRPTIVLMDIDMPGITGIEAVKLIRAIDRDVSVLMLTVFEDTTNVFAALCAGASGYLLKKHVSARLLSSIEELQAGGAPMSPAIARMVLTSIHTSPNTDRYNLTSREIEILASLSKGNSFKLIAAELDISIETVRTHIKNIYNKLEVHSQTEAVAKAINEKLV